MNTKFGGAWWDTLFLFVRDNDDKFIRDFVDRIPCPVCVEFFYKKIEVLNMDFTGDKWDTRRKLWTIRCYIDAKKYRDKDNEEDYNKYLEFLTLSK